jgi:beta-lactam-binding protein with PASTA domain
MPDLTNFSPNAACNQIRAMHLNCRIQQAPPDNPASTPGLVFKTDPPPGATLSRGDNVTIFVAQRNNQGPGGGGQNPPGIP